MQAYRAIFERGRVVPLGSPIIPEGSELIITVLESAPKSRAERQREAFKRFMTAMENTRPFVFDTTFRRNHATSWQTCATVGKFVDRVAIL